MKITNIQAVSNVGKRVEVAEVIATSANDHLYSGHFVNLCVLVSGSNGQDTSFLFKNTVLDELIRDLDNGEHEFRISHNSMSKYAALVTGYMIHPDECDYTITFKVEQACRLIEMFSDIEPRELEFEPGFKQHKTLTNDELYHRAVTLAFECYNESDLKRVQYISNRMRNREDQIAALLHDCIGTTKYTIEYMQTLFPERISDAIEALNQKEEESYFGYIMRCYRNDVARRVKIEELKYDTDEKRFPKASPDAIVQYEKHRTAMRLMTELHTNMEFISRSHSLLK